MKRLLFTLITACWMAFAFLTFASSLSAQELPWQAVDQAPMADTSHSSHKRIGPTGPTGHRGHRGDTGSTGPAGTSGVSLAYGSFFTQEIPTVNPGAAISFTTTAFSTSNVTLMPAGVIQLTQTGDYLVVFGTASTSTGRIAVTINGSTVPGTNVSLPPLCDLSTVAQTVRVTTSPATLQLINNGTSHFTLCSQGANISAFITLEKINDLPNP